VGEAGQRIEVAGQRLQRGPRQHRLAGRRKPVDLEGDLLGVLPLLANARPKESEGLAFTIAVTFWQLFCALPLFLYELAKGHRGVLAHGPHSGRTARTGLIALAAHEQGKNAFSLARNHTVSLSSIFVSEEQQEFFRGLGDLIAEGGRLDILACGLAEGEYGQMLVNALEEISGVNVAALRRALDEAVGVDFRFERVVDLAAVIQDRQVFDVVFDLDFLAWHR